MNLVKENLRIFIPALVDLVDEKDFPWEKINNLFTQKIKDRISDSNGEIIKVEASIYDIIVEAKKQNLTAIGLLDFLNKLFEELTDNLEASEKLLIKSNVKQMLISLDNKYLNFLGEIATLNNLIKSKAYRLIAIEERIPNGKSIDFKLQHINKQKPILVEIVNIHLDSKKVENNPEAIRTYLTCKLTKKIESKTSNLVKKIQFHLIPVIWGSSKDLKIYSDFFKSNSLNMLDVEEPIAYLTYSDTAGYYEHYFQTISKLFKEINPSP
jgi:uncharacterized protein YlaI